MAQPIPLIYRLFFLYVDPLLCFSGVYLSFFDPSTFISNGVPSTLKAAAHLGPLSSYLLHALGSWSISILSLQILILHNPQYKSDVKLWKIFQFSVLLIDLALVYSVYLANPAAAFDVKAWNSGDWTNNGILALVIGMRSTFLLGVGGAGKSKRKG